MKNVNWTSRNPNLQKKLNRSIFFYFFLILEVFKAKKTELPTLKNKTNLKMHIKNNQKYHITQKNMANKNVNGMKIKFAIVNHDFVI